MRTPTASPSASLPRLSRRLDFSSALPGPSLTNVSRQYNIPRHRLTILTKCFNPVPDTLETNMHDPTLKTNRDYVWPLPPGEMCRG
jgi:hypothetical protein